MGARPAAPRFHFVGGKGGVGKTTCAAAIALRAADRGLRAIVASTDPAPSLGDAFCMRLGHAPRKVALPEGRLDLLEIAAPAVMRDWLTSRKATLQEIALRGTWLDEADVTRLLGLSLPGIDELAALLELARLGRSGRYDLIVVDTAPTGHTLRMLAMPATLAGVAGVFQRMQEKHRAMVAALAGRWSPDTADALIAELTQESRELTSILTDKARTSTTWVTLPESTAIEETVDALRALRSQRMHAGRIVVNRVIEPRPGCHWCSARGAEQRSVTAALISAVGGPAEGASVVGVGERPAEPIGVPALRALGREIEAARPIRSARRRRSAAIVPGLGDLPTEPCPPIESGAVNMLLFGGKGGVGKTTCAAASAIAAARRQPARRVLLLSVDPAHSLGDVLAAPLSGDTLCLSGGPRNLTVRELDPSAALRHVRERYAASIDAMFDRMRGTSSFDAAHDRRIMHALLDLAPPGLDEIAAILHVTSALAAKRADLVVVDTAPTGHALRLLEMPALIHDWTKALMQILLKYQPVVRLGDLGSMLVELSREIAQLRNLLGDSRRTSFVVVTRAARLPRAETMRLMPALARLGIHVPAVVVNAIGHGTCAPCRRACAAEREEVAELRRLFRRSHGATRIILAGSEMPPPRGAARLLRWRRRWVCMRDTPRPVRPGDRAAR
jgi:arsenite/tail-anchored protein-transporting ATPase